MPVEAIVPEMSSAPGAAAPARASPAHAILIVDDEPQIRRAVRNALRGETARVLEAATGGEGVDLAASGEPDLIVLDLSLPDLPGIEVCREVRRWSDVPIVVLSARHLEQEKIALFEAGADDYVTKPFSIRELAARVRAHLRRTAVSTRRQVLDAVERGGVRIDVVRRSVTRAGEPVHLTPIEWRILSALRARAGRTLTHQQLFEAVWGRVHGNPQLYLRVHITNLRRKVEPNPTNPIFVVTEPGVGYRFEERP